MMQNRWDEDTTKKIIKSYLIKEWGYAIGGALFLLAAMMKTNIFDNPIILIVVAVFFLILSSMASYNLVAFKQHRRLMLFIEELIGKR